LSFINPFPKNFSDIINRFEKVIVAENNLGQLAFLIQGRFLKKVHGLMKVKGQPFSAYEISRGIIQIIENGEDEVFC